MKKRIKYVLLCVILQMFFCRVRAYAEKLSSGKTYIIRSALDNDYVLDIENKGTKNGTKVQLSHYSEKGAQKFTIQKVKGDYYRIIDVNSGKAVTATDTLGMYLWEWNGKFPSYLTQLFSFLGIILAVAIFVTVLLLKAGVNPNSVIHVWVILLFFAGPIFLFRDAIYKALYFVGETIMKIIGSIVAIFILFFYFFGDGEGDRERREGRTDGAPCSHYDRDYCEGCSELNRYDHKYVNRYVDLHRCDDLNRYVDPNKSPEENIRGY